MNKKIILPLAVLSLGLVSCNGWKNLTDAEAIEKANKIVEKQNSLEDLASVSITKTLKDECYIDNVTTTITSSTTDLFSKSSNYGKEVYVNKITQGDKIIESTKTTTYYVKNDGVFYELVHDERANTKTKKVLDENGFNLKLNEKLSKQYHLSQDYLTGLGKTIDSLKAKQEEIKDKKDQYVKYTLKGKADYDFDHVIEQKLDDVETILLGKVHFESNSEIKYENGYNNLVSTNNRYKNLTNNFYNNVESSYKAEINAKITADTVDINSYSTIG